MLEACANTLEDPTQAINEEHAIAEDATADNKLTLEDLLDQGYIVDLIPNRVLQLLFKATNHSKDFTIAGSTNVNGRLHYQNRLYILDYHALYLCFCQLQYDTVVVGYLGIGNTYELLH